MHRAIKQKFLEGGAGWMTPVLLCLIFGLSYRYRTYTLSQPRFHQHQEVHGAD